MRRSGWTSRRLVRRGLGVAYSVAGFGKVFPAIESTPRRLEQALQANTGHIEEDATRWLLAHAEEVNTWVAVSMTAAGVTLSQESEESPVGDLALVMTLPMLACFMAILRRAIPPVVAVDLVFAVAAIYSLQER